MNDAAKELMEKMRPTEEDSPEYIFLSTVLAHRLLQVVQMSPLELIELHANIFSGTGTAIEINEKEEGTNE